MIEPAHELTGGVIVMSAKLSGLKQHTHSPPSFCGSESWCGLAGPLVQGLSEGCCEARPEPPHLKLHPEGDSLQAHVPGYWKPLEDISWRPLLVP